MSSFLQTSGRHPATDEASQYSESNISSVVTLPNLEPVFGRARADNLIRYVCTDFAPFSSHFPPLQAKIFNNSDDGYLLVKCTELNPEGSRSPVEVGILFPNRFPIQPPHVAILLKTSQFINGGPTHPYIAHNGAIRIQLLDCGANPSSLFDILASVMPLIGDVRSNDNEQVSNQMSPVDTACGGRSDVNSDGEERQSASTHYGDITSNSNSTVVRRSGDCYSPETVASAMTTMKPYRNSPQNSNSHHQQPVHHPTYSDPMSGQTISRSAHTIHTTLPSHVRNYHGNTALPCAQRHPVNDGLRWDSGSSVSQSSLLQAFVVQVHNISERYIRTRAKCEVYQCLIAKNIINTDKRISEIRRSEREAISMKNEIDNYSSKLVEWMLLLHSKASTVERGGFQKNIGDNDSFFLDYNNNGYNERDDKVNLRDRTASDIKVDRHTSPSSQTSESAQVVSQSLPSNKFTPSTPPKTPADNDEHINTNNKEHPSSISTCTEHPQLAAILDDGPSTDRIICGGGPSSVHTSGHLTSSNRQCDSLHSLLNTVKHHITCATVEQCVVPEGDLNAQALDMLSQVQAYEDELRVLEECLARGHLDMDYYLKMVSSVARKAFMARVVYKRASDALMAKGSLSVLSHRYCTGDGAIDESVVESVLCAQHYSFSRANAILAAMDSNGGGQSEGTRASVQR